MTRARLGKRIISGDLQQASPIKKLFVDQIIGDQHPAQPQLLQNHEN